MREHRTAVRTQGQAAAAPGDDARLVACCSLVGPLEDFRGENMFYVETQPGGHQITVMTNHLTGGPPVSSTHGVVQGLGGPVSVKQRFRV